jgi:hypothetical protein
MGWLGLKFGIEGWAEARRGSEALYPSVKTDGNIGYATWIDELKPTAILADAKLFFGDTLIALANIAVGFSQRIG